MKLRQVPPCLLFCIRILVWTSGDKTLSPLTVTLFFFFFFFFLFCRDGLRHDPE